MTRRLRSGRRRGAVRSLSFRGGTERPGRERIVHREATRDRGFGGSPCNRPCVNPLPSAQPIFSHSGDLMNSAAPRLATSTIAACFGVVLAVGAGPASAQTKGAAKPLEGQVVKIAWIDPLSGLMAPVGNNQLNSWKFAVEKFNASNPAGVKFEVTGIDNKLSPTESLNALKSATDQGIRYIIQGNGSSVGLALID